MSWRSVSIAGLALFGVLSVTDFIQTFALIEGSDGRVVEANPVAAEWLHRHGWVGLAIFKAATMLIVAGVIFILARRRPPAGALVAAVGCLALVSVTTYSHGLLAQPPAQEPAPNLIAVYPVTGGEYHITAPRGVPLESLEGINSEAAPVPVS